MKRFPAMLLSMLLVLGMWTLSFAEVFTASEQGFGGEVSVALTIEGDRLAEVTIIGDAETPGV